MSDFELLKSLRKELISTLQERKGETTIRAKGEYGNE